MVVRLRTVGDPADFTGAPGDPDDLGEQGRREVGGRASRPEWCFVAEDESGARIGRVGYRVEPTVTNPAWLGTLPPAELFLFGLWLSWGHGGCDLGRGPVRQHLGSAGARAAGPARRRGQPRGR